MKNEDNFFVTKMPDLKPLNFYYIKKKRLPRKKKKSLKKEEQRDLIFEELSITPEILKMIMG